MPINHTILNQHGRRVAEIIDDARLDGPLIGSITHCHVSSSELQSLIDRQFIYRGQYAEREDLDGYFSNVDEVTGKVRKNENDDAEDMEGWIHED